MSGDLTGLCLYIYDTPATKFQYLYTCVITCLATVSNIQQTQELFASLGTRCKQQRVMKAHRTTFKRLNLFYIFF